MPYTTKDIAEFEASIEDRKEKIEELHRNPPATWAPRYVTHNINLLQEQIDNFKKIIEKIKAA